MATFPVNTNRYDPYKSYRFLVLIGESATPVAGVAKVGGLTRSSEVVKHRAGGDPGTSHKSPGRNKYEAITLERGVTHDPAFASWAAGMAPRQLRIAALDAAGGLTAEGYIVHGCRLLELQAEAGAEDGAVGLAMVRLEHDGWEPAEVVAE